MEENIIIPLIKYENSNRNPTMFFPSLFSSLVVCAWLVQKTECFRKQTLEGMGMLEVSSQ
jgi:hypothetical protein